jgi:S-adenosylmethionine decarboxylase
MKHIKILGRGASPAVLDSDKLVTGLVQASVRSAGMTLLGEPQLHRVELDLRKMNREPFEDEGGISVLGCLSTSHVAIHTWPARGEFHMDLYSCREFDAQAIIQLVRGTLGASELQVTDCSAGCDWRDERESPRVPEPRCLPPRPEASRHLARGLI